MANYVTIDTLVKYGFLDSTDEVMMAKAQLELDSAEEEINNALDKATLADYEDEDGNIPAPLITAICMRCMLNIASPEGMMSGSHTVTGAYQAKIKPYVKLA